MSNRSRWARHLAEGETGAPSLIAAPIAWLKPAEIQLDNLLHSLSERGSTDVLLGQITAVFRKHAEQANAMYKKSATDVSWLNRLFLS